MEFLQGLKLSCNITFYLAFASFVGSLFGSSELFITFPLFIVVVFAIAFAQNRKIRWSIIALLCALVFLVEPTIINIIILSPAIIYCVYLLTQNLEKICRVECVNNLEIFIRGIIIVLVFFGFVLLAFPTTNFTLSESFVLFSVSYFIQSILLLRIIRHYEAISTNFYVQFRTNLPIFMMIMWLLIVRIRLISEFILVMVRKIWTWIFVPVIEFIVLIITSPLIIVFRIFQLEDLIATLRSYIGLDFFLHVSDNSDYLLFHQSNSDLGARLFFFFATVIITVIIIVVIFRIFKRLEKRSVFKINGGYIEEERITLKNNYKRKRENHDKNEVRIIYQKFLKLLKKNDIVISSFKTSLEIEQLVMEIVSESELSDLRVKYNQIRYGHHSFSQEDVIHLKSLYKKIKKEINKMN